MKRYFFLGLLFNQCLPIEKPCGNTDGMVVKSSLLSPKLIDLLGSDSKKNLFQDASILSWKEKFRLGGIYLSVHAGILEEKKDSPELIDELSLEEKRKKSQKLYPTIFDAMSTGNPVKFRNALNGLSKNDRHSFMQSSSSDLLAQARETQRSRLQFMKELESRPLVSQTPSEEKERRRKYDGLQKIIEWMEKKNAEMNN